MVKFCNKGADKLARITGTLCILRFYDCRNVNLVEDVLKPPGSLLATDRSKAVVLV